MHSPLSSIHAGYIHRRRVRVLVDHLRALVPENACVLDVDCGDGLQFVCVTDDEGQIVGVTGQRGIAEYVAESFPQQVAVQRLGCTPWMQQREGA